MFARPIVSAPHTSRPQFRKRANRLAAAAAAVATKLWGILAVVPLVAALPRRLWGRGAIAALVGVLVLYGLVAAGDPSRFHHAIASGNDGV